jgi:glycosyltransferase involved in cell wall biosynthesis
VKVLLVHNRYRSAQPSGENAVVEDEASLLADAGCTVEVVELHSDDIAQWPVRRRATLPARVVWSREGARIVRDAAERFRPDVVHAHNTFPLFSPAALHAARASGAAVVQTLHNFRPLCAAATFVRDGKVCTDCLGRSPLPAVQHGCYRGSRAATVPVATMIGVHRALGTWRTAVDRFICLSDFARSLYVQAGWPEERLAVKPNTARAAGPAREGAGAGFVCLSRLVPEKGLDVLLDAWARAFPDGGPRLTIVGSGEDEQTLRTAAASLHGVELAGQLPRDEAMRRLAGARALVVPSRWFEAFPRAVAEAYALGVPVIASRLGSLAEIVDDGRNGLHATAGSADALAAALRRLADDDALSEELGRGARATWEGSLSPARTTELLLEIYRAAAGDPAPSVTPSVVAA